MATVLGYTDFSLVGLRYFPEEKKMEQLPEREPQPVELLYSKHGVCILIPQKTFSLSSGRLGFPFLW